MSCFCSQWYKEKAEDFAGIKDSQQLAAQLQGIAKENQFERALLVLEFPTPFSRRKCAVITKGESTWLGPIDHDYVAPLRSSLEASARLIEAITWASDCDSVIFQSQDGAQTHGLTSGMTYTTVATSGVIYSLLFFRVGRVVTEQERYTLSLQLRCISDLVKRAGQRLGLEHAPGFELTPQEIDILRWTADGKCTYDVARIMGISENTVNYHVKKVLGKIGCVSKLQAVAHAASWKLL